MVVRLALSLVVLAATLGPTPAARAVSVEPVEVVGATTETSRLFVNPDGTKTLEQYTLPVRARTVDGWRPIDTTLRRTPDGSISPHVTVVGLVLSGGGDGPLLTVSRAGKDLSLVWPGTLPAPELAGDTATYPEVLPGVDLRVTAEAAGFSQVLVVKDAHAAANPALREIRYRTVTNGLSIREGDGATTTAVDQDGTPMFASATPRMWDESGVDSGRAVGLRVMPNELTVLPDQAMLAGRNVRYPLYIDPSFSATEYIWATVDAFDPDRPGQRDAARVGYLASPQMRYRTFFQFRTAPIGGTVITKTWFAITLDHSWSCAKTPVELWHTKTIAASGVTWNNTRTHWLSQMDTESGNANEAGGCSTLQPDMPMEFGSDAFTNVVKAAAASNAPTLTFGLQAADESVQAQWKKFHPTSAKLVVEYNTTPRAPVSLGTVPPTPCGTAAAPAALNTATPMFSAIASDPDNDNVYGRLEILRDSTVLATVDSATVGSGGAFGWPALPAGTLPEDGVLSYRARIVDGGGLSSPDSQRCYFTVDRIRPGPPTVSSVDYPSGVPVRSVGEVGAVTFTGEPDVIGFRYGFQQDKTTLWVAAGGSRTATVPITLWPESGVIDRPLYVRAVDRAGNVGTATAWNLTARHRDVTAPPVRADANGDRLADVTATFDQGDGRTAVWNLLSTPDGFAAAYIGWDGGGFPAYRTRSVNGDFDGDGRTDVAVFREDPDRNVRLYLLRSDGNRFDAEGEPAWAGDTYRLSRMRVAAGDVNADGYDDLMVLQGYAGGQASLWVQFSDHGRLAAPIQHWEGTLDVAGVSLVAGDFDGNGATDLAEFRGDPASATLARLWVRWSDGTRLTAPADIDQVTGVDWKSGRFAATNVNGDAAGQDEILAGYGRADGSALIAVISNTGGTWTSSIAWNSGGPFDFARAVFTAGDFTGDGKGDLATLHDIGNGDRRLSVYASTGTGLAAPQARWAGHIGDTSTPFSVEPGRAYRLHPRHSEKCAEIAPGRTDNGAPLRHADCATGATNQQFLLERLGSTPYFRLKVFGSAKCVDIDSWLRHDNAVVRQWTCDNGGPPQANQQFRLDYVTGDGLDVVVRPRIVHSDKCLNVTGANAVVQFTCAEPAQPNQQFYLRPEP